MELSREEFEEAYKETIDSVVKGMAEHEEVDSKKFYSMVCFLENLSFFSPVIWGLIEEKKNSNLT